MRNQDVGESWRLKTIRPSEVAERSWPAALRRGRAHSSTPGWRDYAFEEAQEFRSGFHSPRPVKQYPSMPS